MTVPLGPLPGTLELLVLKTLGGGSEMHGFAILEWILRSTEEEVHALHRMQARGWLKSDWGVSEKGRRAKYYRLSAEGKKALAEEERQWSRYVEAVAKIAPHESAS
jgi:DNA-binding PadR family transcriptional regulator